METVISRSSAHASVDVADRGRIATTAGTGPASGEYGNAPLERSMRPPHVLNLPDRQDKLVGRYGRGLHDVILLPTRTLKVILAPGDGL
jgi:hypothetical protein